LQKVLDGIKQFAIMNTYKANNEKHRRDKMNNVIKFKATEIKKAGRQGVEAWVDGELSIVILYRENGNYAILFCNGDEITSQVTNGLNSVTAVYARIAKEI
jgi:hypothetical protein